MLAGRGANRVATFRFKASVTPVPQPTPESTGLSESEFAEYDEKRKERTYFFYNKAAVMEYGIRVDIAPINTKFLFIPVRTNGGVLYDSPKPSRGRRFTFAKHAYITNPGGVSKGTFTSQWSSYWGAQSEATFMERIAPKLEKGLSDITEGNIRRGRRVKKKPFSIAFSQAKAQTDAEVRAMAKGYAQWESLVDEWDDNDI
jgi:hypothetical protein